MLFQPSGKFRGSPSIVPGPPEGSQGSTGWGHLSRRAQWAELGGEPAPSELVRPPLGPPLRLGLGNPRGGGAPHLAWGGSHLPPPLGRRPLGDWISNAGAPLGDPIYRGGREGSRTPCPWRLPLPSKTSSSSVENGEALLRWLLHPPPRRRAAGSSSTSPSPLLDQEGGDVMQTVRVLNAEVPSVRR